MTGTGPAQTHVNLPVADLVTRCTARGFPIDLQASVHLDYSG